MGVEGDGSIQASSDAVPVMAPARQPNVLYIRRRWSMGSARNGLDDSIDAKGPAGMPIPQIPVPSSARNGEILLRIHSPAKALLDGAGCVCDRPEYAGETTLGKR